MSGAAIAYFLHNVFSNVFYLYPVRAFLGFCVGGLIPVFYANISKNVPDERKSGIMGFASSFTLFGNLIGPLFCTALLYKLNVHHIFLISGIIMCINTIFTYINFSDYKLNQFFRIDKSKLKEKDKAASEIYEETES